MKFGKLLSLLAGVLFAGQLMAAIVQPDAATTVARNFIYERFVTAGSAVSASEIDLQLINTRESNGQPAYYVFNVEKGGWIIIAADDVFSPVIGYAADGKFPAGQLDANFASFLSSYVEQIDFARQNSISAKEDIAQQWSAYTYGSNPRMLLEGDRDVEPLLDITWDQGSPYNAHCPADAVGPGGHVYAGCVATAMSMIMHYYRYPEVGTGTYSYYAQGYGTQTANFGETHYNWDAMVRSLNGNMGESVNAIAQLQYHCGVAVRMMYGNDGSGAYSTDVPPAIKSYFGYSSTAAYMQKISYTQTAWENTILEHLNANKPLYYSGQSPEGGHAFVLDGFQQTGTGKMFHFNFGWSGSGNGYFSLTDVGGYSSQQGMVKNFVPGSANYPYGCDTHVITMPLGTFEDGSGPLASYDANNACSWLIAPADSVNTISVNFYMMDLAEGDSVKVYNGSDETAPLLGSFGMNSALSILTSTGNRMFIKFLSDGSGEAAGFRADYSSTYPVYCSNSIVNLTSHTGEISDGSGIYNYNNNSICKWKINPGPGAIDLTIAFTALDLEDGVDFLKIFDIPSNQLLANLTGNQVPEPIVSSTGQVMLMFSTNGYNNRQGFEASYYIANVNTSNEDVTKNLSIYPNPASNYTEVKFNLQEPTNVKISVHNLLGKEVYAEPSQLLSGYVSRTLQLGDLSDGVYMIRIATDKGTVTRKLILN